MKQNTQLLRLMTAAIAVFAAMPAWGQTLYNPEIAYTQLSNSGKLTYLYLANRDGSHAVPVHSTPNRIVGIDFAPGGNRIAFTDTAGIKVLNYSASDIGISVEPIVPLVVSGRLGEPDFSADGSRLLYRDGNTAPGTFRAINASGGTPVTLYVSPAGIAGRWLRSDSLGSAFAFGKTIHNGPNVPLTYEIWTVLLDANGQFESAGPVLSTSTQAFKVIEDFDIAHTRDALIMSVGYPVGYPITNNIVNLDLVSFEVTEKAGVGYRAHYSADDSRIIYRTPTYTSSSESVQSLDLGTGDVTRLFTSSKGLGTTDARP